MKQKSSSIFSAGNSNQIKILLRIWIEMILTNKIRNFSYFKLKLWYFWKSWNYFSSLLHRWRWLFELMRTQNVKIWCSSTRKKKKAFSTQRNVDRSFLWTFAAPNVKLLNHFAEYDIQTITNRRIVRSLLFSVSEVKKIQSTSYETIDHKMTSKFLYSAIGRADKTIISSSVSRQMRHFFAYLRIAFNKVDAERLKEVGPDRLCAEW